MSTKYMEWYGAFGLLVTLLWLYLEILRLLAKLKKVSYYRFYPSSHIYFQKHLYPILSYLIYFTLIVCSTTAVRF